MKISLIPVVMLCFFTSCSPEQDSSLQAGVQDSCTIAFTFEGARTAESMVAPGYTGVLRNFWGSDTTKLDFIHVFEEGKITESVFYYADGTKEEEYRYKCGALHGDQRFYYENGQLGRTIPYSYGYRQGTGKLFDEQGKLLQTVVFKKDTLISESKTTAGN